MTLVLLGFIAYQLALMNWSAQASWTKPFKKQKSRRSAE